MTSVPIAAASMELWHSNRRDYQRWRGVASDLLDDAHIGLGCAVQLRSQTGQPFACVRNSPTVLPFRAGVFDCVVGFATLRQIADPERLFQEVSRVLRPGGLFLALQEPFRGVLTTQTQRLLDATSYKLARWWMLGSTWPPPAMRIRTTWLRFGSEPHWVSVARVLSLASQ